MTVRTTFRLAEFDLAQNELPTPEELAENIDDDKFITRKIGEDPVSGEELEYLEKGRDIYYESERDSHNFCYFTYVTDTDESFRIRNENNEEVEENETVLESSFVVYFDTGEFVFQTRQDMAEAWIPAFIAEVSDLNVDNDYFTRKSFDQGTIEQIYKRSDAVSKISFNHPSDNGDLSGSSLDGDMEYLAEICEGLTFSTGQGEGDLSGNSIIDSAVEALEVKQLNTKKGDENTVTVKESGRLTISWNENDWGEDVAARNRAQTIRSRVRPYL
ncbi:hypothetical protein CHINAEXTREME_17085 [Halobiforma lacisalsi AJ5]|uniref:Uncharacterized protein n=1 Tax=Natronobacterium lacisalsi AJ5 TaxID=358396 RepID=M0LNQ7_NATLA|nr:hypothetical protein [Halobiforma lacisalsi]APW99380.1 hypothetical protein CHINAEXTREME_17085 [Halobiforma lacisalsi AJ5]EMA35187.1 hypothetical protein C445_05693 [Halobiforma lacisalsi AJ5]